MQNESMKHQSATAKPDKRAEAFLLGQIEVLKRIVQGGPLPETLRMLAHLVESNAEGAICSTHLAENEGRLLRLIAAPSLSASLSRTLAAINVGPQTGSCGAAAYRKQAVIVKNIQEDPLWEEHGQLAARNGLRASWSVPILPGATAEVRGVITIYPKESRNPGSAERRLLSQAAELADAAVARHAQDELLSVRGERFSKAFQASPTAMGITRMTDGILLEANSSLLEMLECTRGDIVGRKLSHIGMLDEASLKEARSALAAGGGVRDLEGKVRTKSGLERPVLISLAIAKLGDERCVLGSVYDLTERKRVEEELFSSRQMLRTVLDTIPQRVFWKDRNSVYAGCNKPLAQDCGYADPGEIVGKSDYETTSAALADIYRADDRLVMESGRSKLNYEESQVREDGVQAWLRTSKVPLHDKEGRVIGVLGTYEDITEVKKVEQALRQAEQRYRSIFENAVEGMFQSTPEGRFLTVNPAMARILGYASPEELISTVTDIGRQLYLSPEQRAEHLKKVGEHNQAHGFQCQMVRKDGNRIWVSCYIRAVRDAAGKVLYFEGMMEDVTERKQLEEKLRQSQKMEAFGQLAAGVAHDFNNILTVIQGNLSLLNTNRLSETERQSATSQSLLAAERAANLTRQLLTFSRRQLIQRKDLDLNEVVANLTKMLQRLIGEHIALEAHYAPGAAPVHADPGMMEQVVMNLTVNSRDAMPKGGRLILETALLKVSGENGDPKNNRRPGDYVRLSVSDTGCGISPDLLPHIFEPFFTTKEVGKGTGLGLATVFGIVDQHQGWVEVESHLNRGTTFHIYLPRASQAPAAEPAKDTAAPLQRGTETILLVEDEVPVRELLGTLLKRHGYKVHTASTGTEALGVWHEHHSEIDLLMTDVVMPGGMSGRELAERVRQERQDLKVIYCSGYPDDLLGKDLVWDRNISFLAKPFNASKLLQRIRQSLDEA